MASKYGPVNGTKKQQARHASYCRRHGFVAWDEYIASPMHRGERKVEAPKLGLIGRIRLWLGVT